MKNVLISLLTISISFFITTLVLGNFSTTSTGVSTTNGVVTTTEATEESNSPIVASADDLEFSDTLETYELWKDYYTDNIDLATDFVPVDRDGSEITKKDFLEKLKTGKYVPVKLNEAETLYQLYRIDDESHEKIAKTIKAKADIAYHYYLKEGEAMPEFRFKDLNGNLYTKDNTIGNILVIECWYTQCTTCIEEFPKINDLYDRYEGHDDVIFLSLAFEKSAKLKKFLSKIEFRYPAVANQKEFMKNKLGIIQYPTHIIVDEYGTIVKMVNNADSLILALDTIANEGLLDSEF